MLIVQYAIKTNAINVMLQEYFLTTLAKLNSVEIHFGFRGTNNVKMETQMIMMVVLQLAKSNKTLHDFQQ